MDTASDLREFLTTRRARLTPERAGLPDYGGRRRVPGLRREEVALFPCEHGRLLDAERLRELLRRTREVLPQRLDLVGGHARSYRPSAPTLALASAAVVSPTARAGARMETTSARTC